MGIHPRLESGGYATLTEEGAVGENDTRWSTENSFLYRYPATGRGTHNFPSQETALCSQNNIWAR